MTIKFSRHALEKARWREDVEHRVMIAIKKVNEKSVVVAHKKEDDLVKVITLYYTTKLDRLIKAKTVRGAWKKIK